MNTGQRISRPLLILLVGCMLPGCAALSTDGTQVSKRAAEHSGQPQASPVFRAQNHYEWVKRLKIAKSVDSLAGRTPSAASTMMPISLPPTALEQYALVVDQQQQLAWLQGSENYGPFPLTNPDVAHLMNSIAAAWHEQAAWEASLQQQQTMQRYSNQASAESLSKETEQPQASFDRTPPESSGSATLVGSEFDF